MIIPVIIEALEEIGPCDVETLSGHLSQSESMVNSMLVNYMRKGYVRCINSNAANCVPRAYELTERGRLEYGMGETEKSSPPVDESTNSDTVNQDSDGPLIPAAHVGHVAQTPTSTITEIVMVEPSPEKGITEIMTPAPVSKAEAIRRCLQDDGGEMYMSEIAEVCGMAPREIRSLINWDVTKGRIVVRKDENRAIYRWRSGDEQAAENLERPPAENRVKKGIADKNKRNDLQRNYGSNLSHQTSESDALASAGCTEEESVPVSTTPESITVPTSDALTLELEAMDDEVLALSQRLEQLKQQRIHKGKLLVTVMELEVLMKGEVA